MSDFARNILTVFAAVLLMALFTLAVIEKTGPRECVSVNKDDPASLALNDFETDGESVASKVHRFEIWKGVQAEIGRSKSDLNGNLEDWHRVQEIVRSADPELAARRKWERMHNDGWSCGELVDGVCNSWRFYSFSHH